MSHTASKIDLSTALRVHEIVAELPWSRTTLWRIRKAGEFIAPSFEINGTEYWLKDDFEEWKKSISSSEKDHVP